MKRIVTVVLLTLAAPVAGQTIYKCQENGRQVFSQVPCGSEAEALELKVLEPTDADRAAAQDRASRTSAIALEGEERVCIERASRLAYGGVDRQLRMHRQRLVALEHRARRAANNLAGATWESGMREEIAGIHQAMATLQSSADQAYQSAVQRCRDERARREAEADAS